jgi:hypothetical protein
LSKLLASIILGSIFFTACSKGEYFPLPEPTAAKTNCLSQKENPAGRSYTQDSIVNFICLDNYCAFMPINNRNYWIYEDSIFTDGVFTRVQFDTLRFAYQVKSLQDGLVWWKSNISVGLPETFFANDSSIFIMSPRLFTPGFLDVKKEFGMFPGDSIKYLASFDDYAAFGRALKLDEEFETSFGKFNSVLYFEKNARNYRRDQVYFKPGLGVIRYTREKAGNGFPRIVKLQQVSTLIKYHIE